MAYVPFFPLGGFTPLQSSKLDAAAASLESTAMQVALPGFSIVHPTSC